MVENYTKDLNESVYHGAVVSALAVGLLGKSLIKMNPPSLRKFDVQDGMKLVAIVAIFDFTKDYLIKQKIIPNGAFRGSNFLFSTLSKNSIDKEDMIKQSKTCNKLK